MRDVIQKVIETEAEAKRMVEAARAEAGRIVSDARRKALELEADSLQGARAEAERLVKVAAEEAAQEKRKRLGEAASGLDAGIRLDEAVARRAAEAARRCVCGIR